MVLQKQDSGVCLSAMEPSSPTEVAGVARPVAFFVDVGGPATGAGATGTAVRKTPTTSSGSKTTPPRDAGLRRTSSTSSQPSPRSTWSPRTASVPSGRPPGDASASTPKTIGQRFRGTFHLSTKDQRTQERKAAEKRERLEQDRRQREWEDSHEGRSSSSGQRPVAGPVCARPQLTASVLSYDDVSMEATSPTATFDPFSRPPSTLDGTSDYASASRRTSICTSVTSVSDWHSTIEREKNRHELRTAEKRRSVAQRLELQRLEMEEHARQVKLKQEQDLQRANSVRLSLGRQQASRARLANQKVQQRHEQFLRQKNQSLIDLTARQEAINAKLSAAETKAQKIRQEEIQKTKSEVQKRLDQSRRKQRQAEEEIENWRQELVRFNQWQGDNAEKIARQNQARKSMNACKTRLEKEKKQQENMKKLMTNEEKKMADMEAAIESKDSRTRALLKEKEEKMLRSRERALATKRLRDDLRYHYSTNDIDQLSRQVLLERRLMYRGPDSSQSSLNTSIVSLV